MRGMATVTFGAPVKGAELCTMLEERSGDVHIDGNSVRFPVKPFEIVTVRVRLD
jgi:alpha-mannosidase